MPISFRNDSFMKTAEFSSDGSYVTRNRLPKIPKDGDDQVYVIPTAYDQRPDLLAHELYGNSRLWWVFQIRNPDQLNDPIRDFRAGLEIRTPPQGVIKRLTQG
jgi:hypothetical protein